MPAPSPPDNWAEKHVPFYKQFERQQGLAKRFLALPCAVPMMVYMEAAAEGFWKFATTFAGIDEKHYYHQLTGHSLYHDAKKVAQDTHIVSPVSRSKFTRGLFLTLDVVDVTQYELFMLGAFTDGLIDFTTQAMRMTGCNLAGSPDYGQGGPYINAIGDDGSYYGDDFAFINGDGSHTAGPSSCLIGKFQHGVCSASCGFADFGGTKVASSTAIFDIVSNVMVDQHSVDPNDGGGGNLAHVWFQQFNSWGGTMEYECQSAYTGGDPLPLGEAFRDGDNWYAFRINGHTKPKQPTQGGTQYVIGISQ